MEQVKRLGTHEMHWVKNPGEPLRKAILWRGRSFVLGSPFKSGKEEIHIHPNVEETIGGAFPSKGDLRSSRAGIFLALNLLLFRNRRWVVPTKVIVSTNKEGKEIGRTIVRPMTAMKREIVEKALMRDKNANERYIGHFRNLEQKIEELHEMAEKLRDESLKALVMLPDEIDTPESNRLHREGMKKVDANMEELNKTYEEILSTLKEMGFRIRFIAKPGYKYNPYIKCFEKKR